MPTLSRAQLASRAGTTPDMIDRFGDLGLLVPEPDGSHGEGDIPRARMILALLSSGISVDDLGRAAAERALSFGFADRTMAGAVGLLDRTYGDVFAQHGIDPELGIKLCGALGLPFPSVNAPIREDDADMFEVIAQVFLRGVDEASVIRAVRVYSESLRKIALTMREVFRANIEQPMLDAGLSRMQMLDAAATVRVELQEAGFRALGVVLRRQLEGIVFENVVEHVQALLLDTGIMADVAGAPPAIAFVDLVSYTTLTESEGDEAAAALAVRLADLVQAAAASGNGRVVKLLGDGALLHFADPASAARCCLELVRMLPEEGLPAAHAGIDAGPVIIRDGDCFGRTVNLAARVSSAAGAGEVLATDAVREAAGAPDLSFSALGARVLKGFAEPVGLHLVGAT